MLKNVEDTKNYFISEKFLFLHWKGKVAQCGEIGGPKHQAVQLQPRSQLRDWIYMTCELRK